MKGRVTFSPTTFCPASPWTNGASPVIKHRSDAALLGGADPGRFDVEGFAGDLADGHLAGALGVRLGIAYFAP